MISRGEAGAAVRVALKDLARSVGPAGAWRHPTSGVVLLTAFVIFTLLSFGPLLKLDGLLNMHLVHDWPQGRVPTKVVVSLGQRAVGLPVLGAVTAYVSWRRRTWVTVVITVTSVLALNFVVGVIKLATGRLSPRATANPDCWWQGDILYPSGHTANIILVYGLAAYLAYHFLGPKSRLARVMVGLTWFAAVTVTVGIVYLGGHWFTDLVAGLLMSGVALRGAMSGHRRYLEWQATRPAAPASGDEETSTTSQVTAQAGAGASGSDDSAA